MAVALEHGTSGGGGATFSHTCTGASYLTVQQILVSLSVHSTLVTYAGVNMTLIGLWQVGMWGVEIWGLAAPASGANTVAFTYSGTKPSTAAGAASFTGAASASGFQGLDGSTANPVTPAVTSPSANSMLLNVIGSNTGVTNAGGATTAWNDAGGDGCEVIASTGASQTMTWTASISTWSLAVASIDAPVTSSGISKYLVGGRHHDRFQNQLGA